MRLPSGRAHRAQELLATQARELSASAASQMRSEMARLGDLSPPFARSPRAAAARATSPPRQHRRNFSIALADDDSA